MAPRKTTSVDKVYSYGRSFPQGRVRDEHAEHRVKHDPSPDVAHAPVHSDHRTFNRTEHDVDLGRDTFDQTHPAYQKPQDRELQFRRRIMTTTRQTTGGAAVALTAA